MAQQPGNQFDLTTLIAVLNAMSQVLGQNSKNLTALLTSGIVVGERAATYAHISAAGTFALKGSAGTLLSLNINTSATGAAGTIYDASGTASLAGTLVVGIIGMGSGAPGNVPMGPQDRGLALNNGLVVVTTGTADITLGYL
jgi:hypothetical protein